MGDSAVALRYAKALYELAREKGNTDKVLEDLAGLKASLDGDRDGLAKLMHPRISSADKEKLLEERFFTGRDPLVANTLRLLVQRRREDVLHNFFRTYLEVHEDSEGILRVEVETATEIPPDVAQQIRERLTQSTGRKVMLESRVIPELMGGMRFRLGSRLVDGSYKSRLERIERGLRSVSVESASS